MNMRSRILRYLPSPLKAFLKPIYWNLIDTLEAMRGRDSLTPPKSMIFVGDGDFRERGIEFKRYFINLANLKPHHRVLDVGCGIGRMAVPLTDYLSGQAEYWGFDIVQKGIDWCQMHVAKRFPNFHFQHADIHNKFYNPKGVYQSANYKFPYEGEYFDFVFLTSVFTHMLPPDMENYLAEIARVLRQNGKCLITFFILNDESKLLIQKDVSTQKPVFDIGGCFTIDKSAPERAIAYEENAIRSLFERNHLLIREPIEYGSWCGRSRFVSYQDIILATKQSPSIVG